MSTMLPAPWPAPTAVFEIIVTIGLEAEFVAASPFATETICQTAPPWLQVPVQVVPLYIGVSPSAQSITLISSVRSPSPSESITGLPAKP